MFNGSFGTGESADRPADNALAFLMLSTAETHHKLGMVDVRGLHLSLHVSAYVCQVAAQLI